MRAVSLFSNCGAGDVGYRQAGFRFDVLAELEPHRLSVAHLNHPEASPIEGDLRDTWPQVVSEYRRIAGDDRLDLLAACPPCQGMSTARGGRGRDSDVAAGGREPRNLLVLPIANVANALHPRLIVVENVSAFLTRKVPHPVSGEGIAAARLLMELLADTYEVFPVILELAEYGVPQHRVRSFLTFVAKDEPVLKALLDAGRTPFPVPTHAPDHGGLTPVTIEDALLTFELPWLDAASVETATSNIPLHSVPTWDDDRYQWIASIPPDSGRSAWENSNCPKCGIVDVAEDAAICPICHGALARPTVRESDGRVRLVYGFKNSSYRRMAPDRPAATVTTASARMGSDNTIHPWEDRVLSALECQLLQTLPREFKWGELQDRDYVALIREMIGEAVPPRFTEMHGFILAGLLRGEIRENTLPKSDRRCREARGRAGL